jgi:hypothetical protein|tara:strand:- start:2693 stop:3640 length:948 start_codon:yes stop_codon:yes gene_type:complete
MKITKEALRQVIKEELDEVLNEYEDKGPEALDALITKLVPASGESEEELSEDAGGLNPIAHLSNKIDSFTDNPEQERAEKAAKEYGRKDVFAAIAKFLAGEEGFSRPVNMWIEEKGGPAAVEAELARTEAGTWGRHHVVPSASSDIKAEFRNLHSLKRFKERYRKVFERHTEFSLDKTINEMYFGALKLLLTNAKNTAAGQAQQKGQGNVNGMRVAIKKAFKAYVQAKSKGGKRQSIKKLLKYSVLRRFPAEEEGSEPVSLLLFPDAEDAAKKGQLRNYFKDNRREFDHVAKRWQNYDIDGKEAFSDFVDALSQQ